MNKIENEHNPIDARSATRLICAFVFYTFAFDLANGKLDRIALPRPNGHPNGIDRFCRRQQNILNECLNIFIFIIGRKWQYLCDDAFG